jgi:uncharacterized protein
MYIMPNLNRVFIVEIINLMSETNFLGAKAYALHRLANELNPYLTYHSLQHTRDDVAVSAYALAEWHGLEGEDLMLLKTASYFHDLGFIYQRQDHEEVGVDIVREVLPRFGYSHDQIEVIGGIIMATKMPQSPNTLLEAIMADADMNSLGRSDFFEVGTLLRQELALFGAKMTDEAWYEFETRFLGNHTYFTDGAKALYSDVKAHNLIKCQAILDKIRAR